MEINKARMIQDAVIATAERVAKEKGIEQGQKIGEHKKAKEIAQNLLTEKMSPDFVAKVTKLSLDQVERLEND